MAHRVFQEISPTFPSDFKIKKLTEKGRMPRFACGVLIQLELALVVQKVDNAIHWVNHYLVDKHYQNLLLNY